MTGGICNPAKGGCMKGSQFAALLIGVSLVAVGAGLAWKGFLPGMPAAQPQPAAAAAPAASAAPGPSMMMMAAKPPAAAPAPEPEQEAALPPAAPVEATPETPPGVPQFDTVRVEPSGDTVIAGHGADNAKIALMAGDKALGETDADGAGNFVIIPPPLAPGDYVLGLRSSSPGGVVVN